MYIPRLKRKKAPRFPDFDRPVQNSFLTYSYFAEQDYLANEFLIQTAIDAISHASTNSIIYGGESEISRVLNLFPGEHYRLLRAFSSVLKSQVAIEVGTYQGYGSIAMLTPFTTSKVVTYDIYEYPFKSLSADFSDLGGRIDTRVVNLISESGFISQTETISACDFMFVDGPKDGIFEYQLLSRLATAEYFKPKILVLDDIKFMNMIPLWRSIKNPKLDLTSFGHWSGTGLVDVREGLKLF